MKKFLTLFAAFAIALGSLGAVSTLATGNDASYVEIWEDGVWSGIWHGDHANIEKINEGNIANLSNYSTGLWAGCDSDSGTDGWNNCASGFILHIKAGSCVGIWDGTSYSGTKMLQRGYRTLDYNEQWDWSGTSFDNKASSIKWGDWKYVASSSGYQCVWGSY